MKLYVEGGGDAAALRSACRRGFTDFLDRAGLGRKPRIVACGSRRDAFERFCIAARQGEAAFLLVDSEAPVAAECEAGGETGWLPWRHLERRPGDGWDRPAGTGDGQCHLMVQCMENWFIADAATLSRFFGQGFLPSRLPAVAGGVEAVGKARVHQALAAATKGCRTKGRYGKAAHSFEILSLIDPAVVVAASPWAARFVKSLKGALSG